MKIRSTGVLFLRFIAFSERGDLTRAALLLPGRPVFAADRPLTPRRSPMKYGPGISTIFAPALTWAGPTTRTSVSASIAVWFVRARGVDADNADFSVVFHGDAFRKYGFRPGQLVVHSDNGASMKTASTMALLEKNGIIFSHSRPRVSNDTPYSEFFFSTLKYQVQRQLTVSSRRP